MALGDVLAPFAMWAAALVAAGCAVAYIHRLIRGKAIAEIQRDQAREGQDAISDAQKAAGIWDALPRHERVQWMLDRARRDREKRDS